MVYQFSDLDHPNAHAEFQNWRKVNADGFFLNCRPTSSWMLHRVSCLHVGNTAWQAGEFGSLTAVRKVCSNQLHELIDWTQLQGHASPERCNDCKPGRTKRYWTFHWKNSLWRNEINPHGEPVAGSGSSKFSKRGVANGDVLYVISLKDGQLMLGGRMTVEKIVSRKEAAKIFRQKGLYDVNEWVVDTKQSGTPLNLKRQIAPELSKQLRFLSNGESVGLVFRSRKRIHEQSTRGVREITPESAALLDRIIDFTDPPSPTPETDIITSDALRMMPWTDSRLLYPDEIEDVAGYHEGDVQQVLVNRYERNHKARQDCIALFGAVCILCGFDFGDAYTDVMSGFIHVHHLEQLAHDGTTHPVDPKEDLRPVCPNCHAVIHSSKVPRTLNEVGQLLAAAKRGKKRQASRLKSS